MLGVVVVLGLPLLVPVLDLSLTQYGVLAGLTVYAVPQVLAATLPIGELSNQVGTVVKLVRVLMLGPVVLALSLFDAPAAQRRGRCADARPLAAAARTGAVVHRRLSVASRWRARSASFRGDLVRPLRTIAAVLTTIAMAALGLGVDVRIVAKAGPRVATAVTVSLVVLGMISFALIRLAGIP